MTKNKFICYNTTKCLSENIQTGIFIIANAYCYDQAWVVGRIPVSDY
ncbi:hypothetical protein HMPREF9370_0103, partial [Neisseria wadsworthii 9715]